MPRTDLLGTASQKKHNINPRRFGGGVRTFETGCEGEAV